MISLGALSSPRRHDNTIKGATKGHADCHARFGTLAHDKVLQAGREGSFENRDSDNTVSRFLFSFSFLFHFWCIYSLFSFSFSSIFGLFFLCFLFLFFFSSIFGVVFRFLFRYLFNGKHTAI